MSTVAVLSNPIHRRHRRKHHNPSGRRRRRSHRRHRNPESLRERIRAARKGWRHRHHRRHRNPMGEVGEVIIPAAIGAAGAIGLNILLGYVTFLPASLQTGYGRAGVQIAGALAIGALGPKMGLSRRTSYAIAGGITVIALYDVVSAVVASKFPNINLGEVYTALPSGLVPGKNLAHPQGGMGEVYMIPQATTAGANTFG